MLRGLQDWRENRRLDRLNLNPRSAKPTAINTPWGRRRYWRAVFQTAWVNLGLWVLLVAVGLWWFSR